MGLLYIWYGAMPSHLRQYRSKDLKWNWVARIRSRELAVNTMYKHFLLCELQWDSQGMPIFRALSFFFVSNPTISLSIRRGNLSVPYSRLFCLFLHLFLSSTYFLSVFIVNSLWCLINVLSDDPKFANLNLMRFIGYEGRSNL